MKKTIMAAAMLLMATSAFAQGDNYNRLGISYTNTHYGVNKEGRVMIGAEITGDEFAEPCDFSGVNTNGFTIDYVHGWGLSKSLPMYLEAGIRFGYSGGSGTLFEPKMSDYIDFDGGYEGMPGTKTTVSLRNTNLTVPVNFVWKFNVRAFGEHFKVAPYTGINFRLNLSMQGKLKNNLKGDFGNLDPDLLAEFNFETDWFNLFSKDGLYDKFVELETGEPGYVPDDEEYVAEMRALAENMTWKRFQTVSYTHLTLPTIA